jgi:hypothetical protein
MNKLQKNIAQIRYQIEESVRLYNDSSGLRLSIIGIPIIGTVIDTILTTKGQNISYNRLLGFINELDNEIRHIEDRLIDLEFVESDEFYDLLIKIFESVIKTRHDEKRKLYARILKNRCIAEDVEINPEFFIDIIHELTLEELTVAIKLYELKTTDEYEKLKKVHEAGDVPKFQTQDKDILALTDLNIDKDDYTFLLLRLQRAGLIKEQTGMIYIGYEGGVYLITGTFKKLMEYFKD